MAFGSILGLADFQDLLRMASVTFDPQVRGSTLSLGGGEDITAFQGYPLWGGAIQLSPEYHADSEADLALLRRLNRTGQFFTLTPPHMQNQGAAVGQIYSSSAANLIAIGGVTSGREFKRGEFFSFTFGSSPVKYALHQFAEDAVADSVGNTPEVEIEPPLQPGWTVGTEVRFSRPICKAKLVGGSLVGPNNRPVIAAGTSLQWVQTFR